METTWSQRSGAKLNLNLQPHMVMNICPHIVIGGDEASGDLALSVERRAGRMPVSLVRAIEIEGIPHLSWTAADGEDEAISFRDTPFLMEKAHAAAGCVLVEFDAEGVIESTAQIIRADEPEVRREVCHG